jgi:CRISPR type III-B/RAMP module-associated protein Cmr5
MKAINKLLPTAMEQLVASGLIYGGNSILKEYDGYVASFAPSVITAGLKATLSFYTDKHKFKNGEADMPDYAVNRSHSPRRYHILHVLYGIYCAKNSIETNSDLLTLALDPATDERKLKADLMECAITLKLVMRNFKQLDKIPSTNPPTAAP